MSDSAALWTVAHQAPLSMGFSKQNTGVGCISSSRGSSRPWGFPGGASGKEPAGPCRRQKRHGSILGLGRSPRGGHGIPLQYSCLENPTDRGAWWVTVHGVMKSWIRLKHLARRDRTRVSCVAGRLFTFRATREALLLTSPQMFSLLSSFCFFCFLSGNVLILIIFLVSTALRFSTCFSRLS